MDVKWLRCCQFLIDFFCETAEDLIAYAKTEGVELTKEEAEAYLEELSEFELKDGDLRHVAGGLCGDVGAPPVGPSNYQ